MNTDYYSERHKRRREEAAINVERLAWFNVGFLLANLKRRNMVCTVSREKLIEISILPCFYCGDDYSGGIDRVDALQGYHLDNMVSSCKICNYMKGGMHKDHFLAYCTAINFGYATNTTARALTESLSKTKQSCRERGVVFDLTIEKYNDFYNGACTFCGLEKASGIDRIDSSVGYINDNCRSMCFVCNYIRGGLSDVEFYTQLKKIVSKHLGHSTTFIGVSKFTSNIWDFTKDGANLVRPLEKTCNQCNITQVYDEFSTGKRVCKSCRAKNEREKRLIK